ncbi:hypothetical protein QYM36_015495 [Artemia franciscana]|uniref:Uncharacterized protein n=1 Tax=Artemia franciscana TaxID=6661 RepID=A0AA88HIT8_ARTSF|nr:hypothetical protein QYM36_015495 [Artemia franciscana]
MKLTFLVFLLAVTILAECVFCKDLETNRAESDSNKVKYSDENRNKAGNEVDSDSSDIQVTNEADVTIEDDIDNKPGDTETNKETVQNTKGPSLMLDPKAYLDGNEAKIESDMIDEVIKEQKNIIKQLLDSIQFEIFSEDDDDGTEDESNLDKENLTGDNVIEGTMTEITKQIGDSKNRGDQVDVQSDSKEKPEIIVTEAKWNVIQDNMLLKKRKDLESKLLNELLIPNNPVPTSKKKVLTEEEEKAENLYKSAVKRLGYSRPIQIAALDDLKEAAGLGNIKAQERLAWMDLLDFGPTGVPSLTVQAVQIFEKYAAEGSADSQAAIGFLHASGLGGYSPDQAKAMVYLSFGALHGSSFAQMMLGYRHWSGIATSASCERSLDFYRKLAITVADGLLPTGGSVVSRVRLLDEAENQGYTTSILDSDLVEYYQMLAENGDVNAQMYMEGNEAVPQDNATSYTYFKNAADLNDPIGQSGLGMLYLQGRGVPKDLNNALKYFMLASEQGWVEGHLQLGTMYMNGNGVTRDYKMAVKYFNLAGQSGSTLALFNLAQMHATGTGMLRNCHTAVELYKNVAERGRWSELLMEAYSDYKDGNIVSALYKYMFLSELGFEIAQSNAAYILDKNMVALFGEGETYARALQYWSRAASQNYPPARVKLGDYYYYGLGTSVNYEIAAHHYRIAADQLHDAQAMFNLGWMHENGLGMKQDLHLAKRFYDSAGETSVDAKVPVALALIKLSLLVALRRLKEEGWKSFFSFPRLDIAAIFGPDWDIYLMTILLAFLVTVVYLRRPQ